ncbi:hypothetical protein EV426DRAFT_707246 [Tirmania nivea]|nr:hypothetical protein EV426DRAFT_707246 [Tirmania nivea]
MTPSQLPLQQRLSNVYGSSNQNQQPIQPPPPRQPSPQMRPPAPPPIQRSLPMQLPLQAQLPEQFRLTPPLGIPASSTAQKRKYEAPIAADREYPTVGPGERNAQRQAQPAPLPFYPRLDHIQGASQQELSSTGSRLYNQHPQGNLLFTEANTCQPRGMPQHPRSRALATESIEVLPRQTRRSAFVRRQVQRRAEMERLAAERIEWDMVSDEGRYWKGGVQNVARIYEEFNVCGPEQFEQSLSASCERVWEWVEKVPDDEEHLEKDLALDGYEWE